MRFTKMHGAGNDYVYINCFDEPLDDDPARLAKAVSDRRFGIGADGLILLQSIAGFDFEMIYFNSDGKESSMCGNGGRCITSFANKKGIIGNETRFVAIDGIHDARILKNAADTAMVSMQMKDVLQLEKMDDDILLDTGSPHFVRFVSDIKEIDVYKFGKEIRNREKFRKEGINVNFVEYKNDKLFVRTYERGVENETLSCGTGVIAVAIAASVCFKEEKREWEITTPGGELKVSFEKENEKCFNKIWLEGPAVEVFEGRIDPENI